MNFVNTAWSVISAVLFSVAILFSHDGVAVVKAQSAVDATESANQPVLIAAPAAESPRMLFFWGDGCPHCEKQKQFHETLFLEFPDLIIEAYEIYYNPENQQKMIEAGEAIGVAARGVPFTVIGEQGISGFGSPSTTGQAIRTALLATYPDATVVSPLSADEQQIQPQEIQGQPLTTLPETISLPLFGEIELASISLPLLTILIGGIDGFNPCAMWALIFLISILIKMQDRKRMWILGSAFILTSGAVYFLFLAAWLNVFLFVGYIWWIRGLIGLLALGAGGYYLYDAYTNREGACKVIGGERKQQIFAKIRSLTEKKHFFIALLGIIALAIAVNMIELVCSAGLPAIYTQVLSLSDLPIWQYYAYLGLYILFFMFDDLLVFFVAMTTLRLTGMHGKYARYSHIIGGFVMLILGLLLLFKPEWLMFG